MMNRQIRVKKLLIQLNASLVVAQSKFNAVETWNSSASYLIYSAGAVALRSVVLLNCLKIKTLNDFIVYLRNINQFVRQKQPTNIFWNLIQENVVNYKSTILNYCMMSISKLIFSVRRGVTWLIMIKICTRSPIYLFYLFLKIIGKYIYKCNMYIKIFQVWF